MTKRQLQIRNCENGFMVYSATESKDYIANTMEELQARVKEIFEAPEPVEDKGTVINKADLN